MRAKSLSCGSPVLKTTCDKKIRGVVRRVALLGWVWMRGSIKESVREAKVNAGEKDILGKEKN